jgi:hypothetical protein
MLDSAYIPKNQQEMKAIESVAVTMPVSRIAAKCGLHETTTADCLDRLIEQYGLLKVSESGSKGKTYTLNFTPMLEWETTKTARARKEKERRKQKAEWMRKHRAKSKTPVVIDAYSELVAYAENKSDTGGT